MNTLIKWCVVTSFLALGACNSSTTPRNNDQKLPAAIVSNPHTADGIDPKSAALKPTMDFADTVHTFGTLREGESVSYDFSFTNNGKSPLVISQASGSCGCTVPEYPHDPVQPGKSGVMKVTFNSAGKHGHQEKSVTIHTNTLRNLHMLYIKGEVETKK